MVAVNTFGKIFALFISSRLEVKAYLYNKSDVNSEEFVTYSLNHFRSYPKLNLFIIQHMLILIFAPSSDYHLFRSMTHFLRRGRAFDSLGVVENGCSQQFLPPNLLSYIVVDLNNWYKGGLK